MENYGDDYIFTSWDKLYQDIKLDKMSWFYEELDPDLAEALSQLKINQGHFLDLGTGPGTQALMLFKKGFQVTATDISKTVIDQLLKSHSNRNIHFMVDNILKTHLPDNSFDYLLDRGCLHALKPAERAVYVQNIHKITKEKGLLFLKCMRQGDNDFADDDFPYQFTSKELKHLFFSHFNIVYMKKSIYHGTYRPAPSVWFAVFKKI